MLESKSFAHGEERWKTYVGEVEGREPACAEEDIHKRHGDGIDRVILQQRA